mgnify:CR=1 FL=1
MDQTADRADVSIELIRTKARFVAHTLASIVAFALLVSAALALFGPAIVSEVPQSLPVVELSVDATDIVPVGTFAQLVVGIVAVALLSRR